MSMESKIEYMKPLDELGGSSARRIPKAFPRLPWPFLVVVVVPTLLAFIYCMFIAAPQFVSEARFIVRAPAQEQPSSVNMALQGVGLSSNQTDVFAVHEYIQSRDGLADLNRRMDLATVFGRASGDFWARYPRPWDRTNNEGLYEAYKRFVTVGYDSTKGISTLRVKSFRSDDAQRMSVALLDGGESLINRLNERAYADALKDAGDVVEEAEIRLVAAQNALAAFRNREQFIDPSRSAVEGTSLIGDLMGQVATLRAERSQLAEQAPASPQLATLDARIRAYERQIEAERAKLAGAATSLAPKIGVYERLVLDREMADRAVTQARGAYDSAERQARNQRLYLQRVVEPNAPDTPTYPHRWLVILAVFATTLAAYGLGWLVVASISEHRQD